MAGLLTTASLAAAQSAVPAGFEALLEKQTTLLDIYFGDEYITSVIGEYNTNELELSDPGKIAQAIPALIDRQLISTALTGVLENNAQLRCYSRGQQNCGLLQPEVAGVIFDEDRFRVDVFVNPEFLSLQTIPRRSFLPASDAGWSFLQNFGNAFAGDNDDPFDTYSFNAASMLAHGETRFLLTTSYADVSDWTADEILIRRDFQGRENQLGYFRTVNDASLRFIPEVSLRGIRTASTLDTRTDLNSASGRELTIFLVNRSRVSLFKDDRLVSSSNYDAGNQVIDTSRLPNGAYPITIQIEDSGGNLREEQRFYVKSSNFPPRDQTLWGVELGEQVRRNSTDFIPEAEGDFYGRVSISERVLDNTALNGGVAVRGNDGIFELGLDQLSPYYDLQLNGALGSDKGYGLSMDARTRWGNITLSGNYRESWSNRSSGDDFIGGQPATDVAWFAEDSQQWSSTLAWYVGGGTLNLSTRNTRLASQENTEEYSIAYFYPLLRKGKYQLDLDVEASEFNDLKQVLVSLRFRWNEGNFTHTGATQYQYRERQNNDSEDDVEYEVGTTWYDRSRDTGELSIGGRASHRADFDDASADLRWRGRLGELDLEARHERSNADDRTFYTGNYYSSFAWSEGGLALGGEEQSRAAILVELSGEQSANTWFDVLIDGAPRGTAQVGSRNLITIQPFQTYEVEILPRGEGFVSYEQKRETVTLYPGNVASLSWDVSPVNVVFGRLLDQVGEPVRNAVIRGAAGLAMTDDYGYFQAEVKTSVTGLRAETRAVECEFELPEYQPRQGIGLLGTLGCETRDKTD